MRRLNQFGKPSMISPRRLVAALASVSTAASVFAAGMSGSGGNVDFQDYKYMVHTFTNAGDFVLSGEGDVELLLVGGGGGGGGCIGGGGGGGGVISTNLYLTSGTYHITVGAGGAGRTRTIVWRRMEGPLPLQVEMCRLRLLAAAVAQVRTRL